MDNTLIGILIDIDDLNTLTDIVVIYRLYSVLSINFATLLLINLNQTTNHNCFILLAPVLKLVTVIINVSFGGVLR